ncbi:MAG: ATP-binding protein, partial [Solobacterium sp.]|nr:ATP-binding protein [Solobacterium sp.]
MTFEECRELKFYQEKENVLMYGGSGTGKTMLAICIGRKACMADIPV